MRRSWLGPHCDAKFHLMLISFWKIPSPITIFYIPNTLYASSGFQWMSLHGYIVVSKFSNNFNSIQFKICAQRKCRETCATIFQRDWFRHKTSCVNTNCRREKNWIQAHSGNCSLISYSCFRFEKHQLIWISVIPSITTITVLSLSGRLSFSTDAFTFFRTITVTTFQLSPLGSSFRPPFRL